MHGDPMNGTLQVANGGDDYRHVTMPCSLVSEEQLRLMFRAVLNNCPAEVNARQKYVAEEKGGYVFLQIISSFKIKTE